LDVGQYVRIVLARKWFLVATFLVVVGVAALYTFTRVPLFKASTLILLQPKEVQFMGGVRGIEDPMTILNGQEILSTQYELLGSKRVAEPVWRATGRSELESLGSFVAGIKVEPQYGTQLVRVSYQSPDRVLAAKVADALVESYMRDSRERAVGITGAGLASLRAKTTELRTELDRAAKSVAEFRRAHPTLPLGGSVEEATTTRLTSLNASLFQAETERIDAQALVDALKATGASGADSDRLHLLRLEVARIEEERSLLLARRLKEDHPSIVVLKTRLEAAQRRIDLAFASELAAAESRHRAVKDREDRLRAEVAQMIEATEQASQDLASYRFLVQAHENLTRTYEEVAKRIEEVELADSTTTRDMSVFWMEHAEVPKSQVYPNKTRLLGAAGVLGVLLGIALCLLVDYLDRSLKTREDIERLLGHPVIGHVPCVDPPTDEAAIELQAAGNPLSPLAEAFRTIRTGVSFGVWADPVGAGVARKVMVTSTLPRDGKTIVSVNLAIAMAQQGKRTLLIDCDLRRPRLHQVFGVDREVGLSSVLAGEEPVEALERLGISVESVPGLTMVPSGPCPPNPADLLNGDRMAALLKWCDGKYDWVVLDAPPSLIADPVILSTHVGNVVFVVRSFATPRELAQQACRQLANVQARIVGIVINNADLPKVSGYGYGYGGYGYGYGGYGYGSPQDAPASDRPVGQES
jgi:polysaccharide biosynthesis transport protein